MIEEVKIFKNIIINSDQHDYVFLIDELIKSAAKLFNYRLEINKNLILNGDMNSTENRVDSQQYDNLYNEFTNNIKIINRLCNKYKTKVIFQGNINCREEVNKFLLDLMTELYNN